MSTQSESLLMSLLSSKTCSSVAQMCHCEAVELCVVLDAAPCFFLSPLPYSCHLVLVGTQSIHHTAKAYHHLQCGTVSSPAFNRHFTWLKNKKTTTNHTRSLSSKVGFLLLSCLNPEAERITHNISHRFFPLSSWVGCCCDDRHRSIACCCWGLELSDAGLHALQYERGDGLFWWSNWERSCTCHVWGYHIYACGVRFGGEMKALFVNWPWLCWVMAGRNVWQEAPETFFFLFFFVWLHARSIVGRIRVSQTASQGGEAGPGERGWARIRRGREKAREWKGAHEESCLLQLHRWCSRWDGRDGWIDKERGWDGGEREMAREHVFDSVHKEHRIGELPRESL